MLLLFCISRVQPLWLNLIAEYIASCNLIISILTFAVGGSRTSKDQDEVLHEWSQMPVRMSGTWFDRIYLTVFDFRCSFGRNSS
jgi:hypothetical protein